MPGLDVARVARIVVKRPANFLDAGGDCLVANGPPTPNLVKQLLLSYETGRLFRAMLHCCGFWSEPSGPAVAVQLAGFDVEANVAKRR